MNKLLTKIVGAVLGASMAVGVGVGVAINNDRKELNSEVEAASKTVNYTISSSSAISATNAFPFNVSYQGTYSWSSPQLRFTSTNGVVTFAGNSSVGEITSISIGCSSAGYAPEGTATTGYTTSVSSSTVTISGSGASTVVWTLGAQGRLKTLAITYNEATTGYSITKTITNGTATGATSINPNSSATVTITPNDGFKLPSDVTVTGATKAYNSSTGVVTLSNPTGNVTVSATCPALQSYTVTKTITHGTATGATSITENGNATVTITPDTGYKLPSTVSVTGATSDYNSSTGVVSLSAPTGNVIVSATMDVAAQYSVTMSLTRLTANPSSYIMYENEEVNITLSVADSTKYSLPSTITVTNSSGYGYNSSTGVITLHGSQGNVTITASAIAKPAEESEEFDFTDSGLWVGSEKNANNKYTVYTRTVDLVTMIWETNGQSSLAGAYWNPGRVYVGHKVTISALTGQGAATTIKSVTFHTVKNGTSSTTSGVNGATTTVTKPTTGAGTIASSVSDQDVTYTITGTVTEFNLVVSGSQTRWSTVEVVYMKDQSDVTLNSISATCSPVLVSQTIKPIITFSPQNATNKNVSYAIVENTDSLASVDEDGTITGLGNGTARLRITPEDNNASAITIDVTVNALPNIYGVEVGKKYAMVKDDYELSGIYESAVPNYGTVTSYSGNPAGAFPIRVVNGLYARTVALQVEIDSEVKYLSYDAEANGNSLNYVSEINRESSWIFAEDDSALLVRNVAVYGRYLAFASNRFACYQALSASIVTPEFAELTETKTAKEYVQDFVDLYMHMNDYTENKGWCSDGQHSYYLTAKAGYNSIIYGVEAREAIWTGDSDFSVAKLRFETWAVKNNDNNPYDGNDTVVDKIDPNKSKSNLNSVLGHNGNAIAIVVLSLLGATAIGAYYFIKKKKEQ